MITQHSKVSYSGRRILVQTDSDNFEIPIEDIQVLLIATTRAVITSAAIAELAKAQAKVIFTDNSGEPVSEMVALYPNNRKNETLNAQIEWDSERKEILWTKIVSEKMKLQVFTAMSLGNDVKELQDETLKLELNDESNREAVVARKYFTEIFGTDFSRHNFSPINAALNYGYSIILAAVNREIVKDGYLTELGIHHYSAESDFNLGSDLMEPFRPIVDLWVANQRFNEFTPDIKFGLVELLNLEITLNGQSIILRNAITKHVSNCLKFLSKEVANVEIEVELPNEVQNNALNGNV